MSKRNITLLTMGAGNVIVLEETLKSFVRSGICNEVIYGEMLLFPSEDMEIINGYKEGYNLKSIKFPFNYILKNGFSAILNELASHATNDLVVYANTSEVIGEDMGITDIVSSNPDCNAFYFAHRSENHRWFRMYNRKDLYWSGRIHEELQGNFKPYHKPIFYMEDREKDLQDSFKAKVLNDFKEITYWHQLMKIVDEPTSLGGTNEGWVQFAKDTYDNMKKRISEKSGRYEMALAGDYEGYMNNVMTNPEFEKERFESNNMIAFQGDKIHLL